ncbi:MAG: PilZ domain-containing protein [Planctomycetes bacterium]|nr:PilZ domain-containing protein [Planctomycetota bacterium]
MNDKLAVRTGSKVTQEDIARICKIDQGSVSRILNKDTRDSFADDTVQKVFKVARELGYLHPALVTSNRRSSQRRKAGMPAKVAIVIGTNTVYDEGTCEVDEISMSGMMLRAFKTRKQSLPLDVVRFDLDVLAPRLRGFKCRCRIVRFSDDDSQFGLAVRFEQLDEANTDKLKQFLK